MMNPTAIQDNKYTLTSIITSKKEEQKIGGRKQATREQLKVTYADVYKKLWNTSYMTDSRRVCDHE
ncbi:hypothetical protein HWX41_07750 [Bacillus paramycoides]|uniref:hypothetical protein n=1 Tax=Bacillus paramycoides TaxID=2026194 RepID=UPI0015B961A2|nr:hypothetical protein [Bacillus paramycoides]NWK68995.1 hypothetical protein [Bacillus paramycoides]